MDLKNIITTKFSQQLYERKAFFIPKILTCVMSLVSRSSRRRWISKLTYNVIKHAVQISFRTVNSRKKFAIMNKNLQRLPFFQCFHTVTHKVTEKASDLYRNPVPAIQKSSLFEGPNNPKQRCAVQIPEFWKTMQPLYILKLLSHRCLWSSHFKALHKLYCCCFSCDYY